MTVSRHLRKYAAHRAACRCAYSCGRLAPNVPWRYDVEPLKVLGVRVGWKVIIRIRSRTSGVC